MHCCPAQSCRFGACPLLGRWALMTGALHAMANAIRALAMDAVQAANSGHPGMPMGMADVATVLYTRHLKYDARRPDWADRDRFVLSAGHGSMLIYALLNLTGYFRPTRSEERRVGTECVMMCRSRGWRAQ